MMCKTLARQAVWLTLVISLAGLGTGCRYVQNRTYDFCDLFQAGAGVTFTNPKAGIVPSALGVHVQVSDFVNLGAIHFAGSVAEMDGRGFYAGDEYRSRMGFLPMQYARIDQDQDFGHETYFKREGTLWDKRMQAKSMQFAKKAPKELHYASCRGWMHRGAPLYPRGWHYFLTTGIEIAASDPLLTHAGFTLRLAVDPSELSDFLLGIVGLDFKHDDMTQDEFFEKNPPCDEEADEAPRK